MIQIDASFPLTEDEVAAALAAVAALLEQTEEATAEEPDEVWRWTTSSRMLMLGIPVRRPAVQLAWSRVERVRRSGIGSSGIVGL